MPRQQRRQLRFRMSLRAATRPSARTRNDPAPKAPKKIKPRISFESGAYSFCGPLACYTGIASPAFLRMPCDPSTGAIRLVVSDCGSVRQALLPPERNNQTRFSSPASGSGLSAEPLDTVRWSHASLLVSFRSISATACSLVCGVSQTAIGSE